MELWTLLGTALLVSLTVCAAWWALLRSMPESPMRGTSAAQDANSEFSTSLSNTRMSVRELEHRMKTIESEWADTYQKISRLAARLDRARGHDQSRAPAAPDQPQEHMSTMTRKDILRMARSVPNARNE